MEERAHDPASEVPAAAVLQAVQRDVARQTARLWSGIADALTAARDEPWEWVPSLVGETSPALRDMAERSCALELATALRIPESTVLSHARDAEAARRRLPRVWAAFTDGSVGAQHVRSVLEVSQQLEDETCRSLDVALVDIATVLSATRLRTRARLLAARMTTRSLTERHRLANEARRVWVESDDDGMAWLHAFIPLATAHRVKARLNAAAAALAVIPDETRTRDQLRADVAADLLTGDGTPFAVTAHVGVTVPVMTLLGLDERPATLDGVVPMDAETARRLTADAPSFHRILTDPIDSTVLDVGRRSYRPPADLARFVAIRDQLCTAPGCGRQAGDADLDHTIAWAHEGPTSAANLAALCRPHHRAKHETLWRVEGVNGRMRWTSPHGIVGETHPPPI